MLNRNLNDEVNRELTEKSISPLNTSKENDIEKEKTYRTLEGGESLNRSVAGFDDVKGYFGQDGSYKTEVFKDVKDLGNTKVKFTQQNNNNGFGFAVYKFDAKNLENKEEFVVNVNVKTLNSFEIKLGVAGGPEVMYEFQPKKLGWQEVKIPMNFFTEKVEGDWKKPGLDASKVDRIVLAQGERHIVDNNKETELEFKPFKFE